MVSMRLGCVIPHPRRPVKECLWGRVKHYYSNSGSLAQGCLRFRPIKAILWRIWRCTMAEWSMDQFKPPKLQDSQQRKQQLTKLLSLQGVSEFRSSVISWQSSRASRPLPDRLKSRFSNGVGLDATTRRCVIIDAPHPQEILTSRTPQPAGRARLRPCHRSVIWR